MLNFTVGPVQMDEETLSIGSNQIPYFRTSEFSSMMLDNEKLLCDFVDSPKNSRVIFMTGSGTASMEGAIMNFFTTLDKVIVVNGGSFGARLVELCKIHNINYTEIKLPYGKPLKAVDLMKFNSSGYTGFLIQLCETSTGVLYDMDMIGKFCKKNNIFLCVDAISGFLADKISMKKMNINAVITGSQKALALPPGMSFTIMDTKAINRCNNHTINSLYFNYSNYLINGERGQTPFTPAVSILIQLHEKLTFIKNSGGILKQNLIIKDRAEYFRKKINDLPVEIFTDINAASNSITALTLKNNMSAYSLFEILKSKYHIWICPNGGDLKEKVFRIGHIGSITYEQIDDLINAMKEVLL